MTKRTLFAVLISSVTIVAGATQASAQATRTWVSGVGDDVNPCSRTAPCKTFAGAISKTAAGGEINCLDPGGFGALTITKSITIDCGGTFGSTLASFVNGFIINAAGITVTLRNISINGGTPAQPGLNGIRFLQGTRLNVENVSIFNFRGATPNGFGIQFSPSTDAELYVTNSTIHDNGIGATGGGIEIRPTGATGRGRVTLRGVRVYGNANHGLRISTSGNTGGGVTVAIDDSHFGGSTQGISILTPLGNATVGVMLAHSTIANNSGIGIDANGGVTTVRVGDTTITGNAAGVVLSNGAIINTYGNNRMDGNPTVGPSNNGSFTAPPILEK